MSKGGWDYQSQTSRRSLDECWSGALPRDSLRKPGDITHGMPSGNVPPKPAGSTHPSPGNSLSIKGFWPSVLA
jgi:hypothetical protein